MKKINDLMTRVSLKATNHKLTNSNWTLDWLTLYPIKMNLWTRFPTMVQFLNSCLSWPVHFLLIDWSLCQLNYCQFQRKMSMRIIMVAKTQHEFLYEWKFIKIRICCGKEGCSCKWLIDWWITSFKAIKNKL